MKKTLIEGKQAKEWLTMILGIPQESSTIEFKRLSGSKVVSKIRETMTAMTNTDGGLIIIGVDDPVKSNLQGGDRLFGIEESSENFDALMHGIPDINPPMTNCLVLLIKDKALDKTIAVINIDKAEKDFHVIGNKALVREGASNRMLSPQEIIDMSYAKGFLKADQELMLNVDLRLLDTEWFRRWQRARKLTGDVEDVLLKTGLARADDKGKILPTRAAVLLFAELPNSLSGSDKCAVRIFRYRGVEAKFGRVPNLIGRPINIEGPVVELIKEASRQVLDILVKGIRFESGFVNLYEIPARVIEEAITNAVIHRDYHDKKDIEIRIYEDRVEVVSPGMLVYNITLENIGKDRAIDYRNSLLVKHLLEFPDAPNMDANEGVKAMIREMQKSNLYPPTYSTWPTQDDLGLRYYVKLKLINKKAPSEWVKIEDYLNKHTYVNNATARQITGVEQADTMSKLFRKWVKEGLIEKASNGSQSLRDTKYKLKAKKEFNQKYNKN